MKNVLFYSLILFAFGLNSCLAEAEKDEITIKRNFKEITKGDVFDYRPLPIRLKATLHRPIDENIFGKECKCIACIGICDVSFENTSSNANWISILGGDDDESAIIYIIDEVEHAESDFFIDEELVVPVQYGEELVDRTLIIGQYEFERSGVDYEDEDPENPTFGRVVVNI